MLGMLLMVSGGQQVLPIQIVMLGHDSIGMMPVTCRNIVDVVASSPPPYGVNEKKSMLVGLPHVEERSFLATVLPFRDQQE